MYFTHQGIRPEALLSDNAGSVLLDDPLVQLKHPSRRYYLVLAFPNILHKPVHVVHQQLGLFLSEYFHQRIVIFLLQFVHYDLEQLQILTNDFFILGTHGAGCQELSDGLKGIRRERLSFVLGFLLKLDHVHIKDIYFDKQGVNQFEYRGIDGDCAKNLQVINISYTKYLHYIVIKIQKLMGNITEKITSNKYQITLSALAMALAGFAYYQKLEKDQLNGIAANFDPYIPAILHQHYEVHAQLSEQAIVSELIKFKQNPIFRIAITGGPCAGKSTALETISKHFTDRGFHVMVVPEVPTIVAHGGGLKDFYKFNSKERMHFQLDLVKFKIYIEDYIAKLADMAKRPTLILCDRGIVDCAAYMTKEEYQALLDESGWTWSFVRDKRYDSVIFMNTAAKGAEEFYTLENNSARTETAQFARELDDKTLDAWIGHPYMSICPNIKGKPFSYKVDLAIKAVQKTIGIQSTQMIYHKFLVQASDFPESLKVVESQIEQIYLKNNNPRYVQDKIKKRGQDNSYTYQRKYVGPYHPESPFREVTRVQLNSLQYATLAQNEADQYYRPIHIKRNSFSWNGYYFSLDSIDYIKGHRGALLLRFEADKESDAMQLIPPWIKVLENVRTNKDFNLSKIAFRQY